MMIRWLAAVPLFALLCACNPSVQTARTPTPSASPTPAALSLKITGHGTATHPVRLVEQRPHSGAVQYDLLASSFESVGAEGSARAKFSHVHVTFHGKDGSTLTAQAPQAIVDQITNTIVMQGGVQAKNDNGTSLSCDTLRFDHVTEMLYGTGNVVIKSPHGFKATGNRFQSDISLTHTRMQ